MTETFRPTRGWGPAACRAALSITFDNLGEAAELELGLWGGQLVGRHHTAAFIPRLVDALGDIKATYFIEACNAEIYPDAIKAWGAAGHEVGLHAWRHENWEQCPADRRRALLAKSLAAMRGLGVEPVGFRPPGGTISAAAWQELRDAGLLYCSELGPPGVTETAGVISVPFVWRAVDVYVIEEVLGFMRLRCGDPEAPFSLEFWRAELGRTLAAALTEGSHRTVIFHPNFLGVSEEKLAVLTQFLAAIRNQDVWVAPAGDVARFVAQCTGLAGRRAA